MLRIDSEIEILPVPIAAENMACFIENLGLLAGRKRKFSCHDNKQQRDSDHESHSTLPILLLIGHLLVLVSGGTLARCVSFQTYHSDASSRARGKDCVSCPKLTRLGAAPPSESHPKFVTLYFPIRSRYRTLPPTRFNCF